MSEATVIIIPAVLSTKQCFDYVGSQPLFEELLEKHGDILKPVRTTDRGDSFYRRITVDAALSMAEAQRTLISPEAAKRKLLVKKKQSRRFQTATIP